MNIGESGFPMYCRENVLGSLLCLETWVNIPTPGSGNRCCYHIIRSVQLCEYEEWLTSPQLPLVKTISSNLECRRNAHTDMIVVAMCQYHYVVHGTPIV